MMVNNENGDKPLMPLIRYFDMFLQDRESNISYREVNKVTDQLATGAIYLDEHFVVLLEPPYDVLPMLKFDYIGQTEDIMII